MDDYKVLVSFCEDHIRLGRMPVAARRLGAINSAAVPREWALPVANVCRRAGLVSMAMRILAPLVRGAGARLSAPTPGEMAEYGVLLHRCGALTESLEVLAQVDSSQAPQALLYRAFCLFNQWEYEKALPLLESYLEKQTSPYMLTAGQLNYASALATIGRYGEAEQRISALIEETNHSGFLRFRGNAFEVRAQIHLHLRNFSAAKSDLEMAAKLLADGKAFDTFLVRKWQAILSAFEDKNPERLVSLRAEAMATADWETAREADRFQLAIRFEKEKFDFLMFGTPFPPYRELIARELGRSPSAQSYVLGGAGVVTVLDLLTGRMEGPRAATVENLKRKPHQVIEVLARDFYRGRTIGGLFRELFPHEHFDIFSSPARVRQMLYRSRQWCRINEVPIAIRERRGFYFLEIGAGFGIRVMLGRQPVEKFVLEWQLLTTAFKSGTIFAAREARERLDIPRTTFQRLIKWAIASGRLERIGTAGAVSYRVTTPSIRAVDAA